MAETTADVRRDIEMTRERMSTTLAQIEQKMNVVQIVRDHPWPALAVAVGAGVLLSGSSADIKAAGATVAATRGASSKLGNVLDEVVANLMMGVSQAFQGKVDSFVSEIKQAIGAPTNGAGTHGDGRHDGRHDGRSYATGGWNQSSADSLSQGFGGETRASGSTGSSTTGSSSAGMHGADRGSNTPGSEWQARTD
jgi:hypothetical protein